MIDYRFTPEAEEDLFEIWCYIARNSVATANRAESAVYDASFLPRSRGAAAHASMSLPFLCISGRSSSTQTMLWFTARKLSRWKLFACCTACAI